MLVIAGCFKPINRPLPLQFTFKSREQYSVVLWCSGMQSLIRDQKLFPVRSYREVAPGATYINNDDTARLYFVQNFAGTTVFYKAVNAPASDIGKTPRACGS